MTRSRGWKADPSRVDTNAAGRLLTLPAEIRQRIYSYTFQDSVIVRSHVNRNRRKKSIALCDYPNGTEDLSGAPYWHGGDWADFYDWLLSCANDKSLLLTCKAIYNDALASYFGSSTLYTSVCQLAIAPPMSPEYFLHIRNVSLDEQDELHLKRSLVKKAISVLQQFSRLDSLRLSEPECEASPLDEPSGPNNTGLREAILEVVRWGFLVGGLVKAFPDTRISFLTYGWATLNELKVRIADSNHAVRREERGQPIRELVARYVGETDPGRFWPGLGAISDGSLNEVGTDDGLNAAINDESATEVQDNRGHHRYQGDSSVSNVVSTVQCWRCDIY